MARSLARRADMPSPTSAIGSSQYSAADASAPITSDGTRSSAGSVIAKNSCIATIDAPKMITHVGSGRSRYRTTSRIGAATTATRNRWARLPSATKAAANRSRFRASRLDVGTELRRGQAEPALTGRELVDALVQMRAAKLGPQYIDKDQLGVRDLPQHEVGDPLFAARADQQVQRR